MVGRPTFLAFETAKRAISNSQLGLDTVGHNISNVNTPGYTRQRVDQVSWSIEGMSKFVVNKSFYSGMGSVATGISQVRDPFLDARYREESTSFGEYVVNQSGLTDLANIFDEILTDTGLEIGINDLIEALTLAQQEPTAVEHATVVRSRAVQMVDVLNTYSKQLAAARTQQMDDLQICVDDELNPILSEIAYLNDQITKMEVYGNPANELRDARNLLLDELSGFMDISVSETPERVTNDITIYHMTVTLKGSDDGKGNEIVLIDEDKAGRVDFSKSADGLRAQLMIWDANGKGYDETKTDESLERGALRGYLDLINGSGDVDANEPRGIVYYQQYLDNLAVQLATALNDINTSLITVPPNFSGIARPIPDMSNPVNIPPGQPGHDADKYDPNNPAYLKDAGGNILYFTVTENPPGSGTYEYDVDPSGTGITDPTDPAYWAEANLTPYTPPQPGDPGYTGETGKILFINNATNDDTGITAANISISKEWREDAQTIVLSAPNNLTSADITPIAKFVNALSKTQYHIIPGQSAMTFNDAIVGLQTILGLDLSQAKNLLSASDQALTTIDDQRRSISGVVENEEAVNMMIYSNHYNAAVRYMTAMDEALDTVINNMGLVGR